MIGKRIQVFKLTLPIFREATKNEINKGVERLFEEDENYVKEEVMLYVAFPYETVHELMFEADSNGDDHGDGDGFSTINDVLGAIGVSKKQLPKKWGLGSIDDCTHYHVHADMLIIAGEIDSLGNEVRDQIRDDHHIDAVIIPKQSLRFDQMDNNSKMLVFTPHTAAIKNLYNHKVMNTDDYRVLRTYPSKFCWRKEERFWGDRKDASTNPDKDDDDKIEILRKQVEEVDDEKYEDIENPSEAVQLASVQKDGNMIQYIENPSDAVQLASVRAVLNGSKIAVKK